METTNLQPSREDMLKRTDSAFRVLENIVHTARTRHRRVEEEVAVRYGLACRSDLSVAGVKP